MTETTTASTATDAPEFFALGPLGWGHGTTGDEALEAYVAAQLRNIKADTTIFGTRAKFEAALRDGEAAPTLWRAPAGATGFVHTVGGAQWVFEGSDPVPFRLEDEVVS